jgi:hypothetical protein
MTGPAHAVGFRVDDGLVMVEAEVLGQTGRFIVDTGASALVLDPRFAGRAGLVATAAEVTALGAGRTPARTLGETLVRVGGAPLTCPVAAVLDLGTIADHRRAVDGVIGYDLFAAWLVELDFPGRMLRLHPPGGPARPVPAGTVPIATEARIPVAEAVLTPQAGAAVRGRFVLDLGTHADIGVLLGPRLVAAHPQLAPAPGQAASDGAGLGAGRVAVTPVRLRELRLGDMRVAGPAAAAIDTAEGAFQAGLFDGTIGFGLFHDRVVALDYARGRMTVHRP